MQTFFLMALLVCSPQSVLDLAGDATRDGVISFNQEEQDAEKTNAIIILNNCDNDNPTEDRIPDNQDDVVNGENDWRDLEPILIRRLGPLPEGAMVYLEVGRRKKDLKFDDEIDLLQRFRLFDKRGVEIIGPDRGARYTMTERDLRWLEHDALVVYVEGLQFRTSVELGLFVDDKKQDVLLLESAPFILMPHSLPARESYVVESTLDGEVFESKKFVHRFSTISQGTGVPLTQFLDDGDLWIQDECSWGYTQTPRQEMPVVLHMLRQNSYGVATELADNVQGMIEPDVGYFKAFDYPAVSSTLDIGGNLEVTPPTRKFPFGRIYYGSIPSLDSKFDYSNRAINEGFQKFFKRQGMQDPIDLCTDWLIVGHVDELVTFVPQKNGKMKMLIASPKRALDILNAQESTRPLNSKYRDSYGVSTVGELLDIKYLASMSITELNEAVDEKLFGYDHENPSTGSVKRTFMDALSLTEADIIEVPVLYENYKYADGKFAVIALTPSLVNLHFLDRDLVAPKPFMAGFRLDFDNAVKNTNLKVHWVDDWDLYHVGLGEIHCGSNARRGYFALEWWKK